MSDTLPHNLEAERSILGAVLLHDARLIDAEEFVRAEDFYRHAHRLTFEAVQRLGKAREAIDLVTLKNELARTGDLDAAGGPAYLASLVDGVPRGSNVGAYARVVREKAQLRRLIAGANSMLRAAYAAEESASDILHGAERELLGLADVTNARGFESLRAIATRGLDLLEKATTTRQVVTGVASGFAEIDRITRGFHPGQLVTVGARPGIGKTSLALNIATHAATAGHPVGFFSCEMTSDELFARQVSALSRVDGHRLHTGHISSSEWTRVAHAVGELGEAPMFIDETPGISLGELRSRSRRLKAEHGVELVLVDYLQLLPAPERLGNRTLELGAITAGLKCLAKELRIPVVLLSQLSRDVEKRGGRPRLSDLRDSGTIEQDSDVVMFLHRDEGADAMSADLIIAKHRGGPTGTVRLSWHDAQTRFGSPGDAVSTVVDRRLPVGDRE